MSSDTTISLGMLEWCNDVFVCLCTNNEVTNDYLCRRILHINKGVMHNSPQVHDWIELGEGS